MRELINTIEHAVTVSGQESMLYAKHVSASIRVHSARKSLVDVSITLELESGGDSLVLPENICEHTLKEGLWEVRDQVEKRYLTALMEKTDSNVQDPFRYSGLSRTRLYELLKNHHINFPK